MPPRLYPIMTHPVSKQREWFMRELLRFLPNNTPDEHAWPAMQTYVKHALSGAGFTPVRLTIVAQDWSRMDEAFYGLLPSMNLQQELLEQCRKAYLLGYLEELPIFVRWRSEQRERANRQIKEVLFKQLNLAAFYRGNELEVAYGFVDSLANQHEGLPSLVITQSQDFPRSLAFDVLGTEDAVARMLELCQAVGLHARVRN